MKALKDPHIVVAAALFAITFAIYVATTSTTISFWDCGEFVSTSYGLGIPHQPGTPLYVLVGRVFSLLPLGIPVAYKINLMSGFFAALAVAFTYLTTVRLLRNWTDEKSDPSPTWIPAAGGTVGAVFLALSHTFWNSAIEAEVYSLASFVLALTGYLAIKWYEIRDDRRSNWVMLLIVYVMGMSIGFHLGSVLVFPGVFVLALLCRDKALSDLDLWIVAFVMGSFVLSTMVDWEIVIGLMFLSAVGLAVWRLVTPDGSPFAIAGIALFFLGITVHLFMLIRTTQDPFINQSVPDTFDRLMMVIRREQYPPRSPFVREAPLWWQIGHLWGSSIWEDPSSMAGKRVIGYLQQFTFLPRAGFLDIFVPTGLWLYGLLNLFRGNRNLFWGFFTVLAVNSIGLLTILNFTASEVRDRDYFYFGAFQFAGFFIGLGAASLLRTLWVASRNKDSLRILTPAAAVVLLLVAFMPALIPGHYKWFEHDRSGDVIARNYGANMLLELPPDAILFTNGDNDTFPLWYLQEVEGIRRDVRVVNLSLINVDWYIKQLRDIEPSVPMTWDDDQIDGIKPITTRNPLDGEQIQTMLTPKLLPDDTIWMVRDMAVWHIIQANRWERPVYFAVTIPPAYIRQYMPYFMMEGLVYRLTPTKNPSSEDMPMVDSEAILANLGTNYDLTAVVAPTAEAVGEAGEQIELGGRSLAWRKDPSVYRDHNTSHLLRNYPAALCRAAYEELLAGNHERAIEALEMAYAVEPTFGYVVSFLPVAYMEAGRFDAAMEVAHDYLEMLSDPRQMAFDVGENLVMVGETERAEAWARELIELDPDEPGYFHLLVNAMWRGGKPREAVELLEDYVERTGDTNAADRLRTMKEMLDEFEAGLDSLSAEGTP